MHYRHGQRQPSKLSIWLVKLVLVLIGGLIGAALGIYVAARTLPIPTTTEITVYETK